MEHTTLYRKWRPRKFGEIYGQEAVVRTLRRAIETDRVSHAYLFSGPRGTGKTSSAKVLAMGLNCQNSDGPTPEPCGECASCRAVVNNSSLDVVEMDAASNRRIDEIRELLDGVNLAPVSGRHKVYIIDEVHMLTTEAVNALLKTLEEPPERVVFVLATTEKHKILPTIISRCQSFELRRPGVDTLSQKLAEIAAAEGIEAEPEALTIMARAGGGSFRDAEGLLDQLSSFSEGKVTAALVRELLGSAGPETILEVTDALAGRRAADALRVVDRLSGEGRDLGRFVTELVTHLRNIMLLPHAPEVALAEVGAEERAGVEEQAGRIPTAEAVRMIESLGETGGRIRRGGDAKLELELCFVKLARDYTEPSVEALISRLETLEAAVENGAVAAPQTKPENRAEPEPETQRIAQPESFEAEVTVQPESVKPESVELESVEDEVKVASGDDDAQESRRAAGFDPSGSWPGVMQELKRRRQALTAAVYEGAKVESFDGGVLTLAFPDASSPSVVEMARGKTHVEKLTDVLSDRFDVRPRIEVVSGSKTRSASAKPDSVKPDDAKSRSGGGEVRETRTPLPPKEMRDDEPPPDENPPPQSRNSEPEVESGGRPANEPKAAKDGDVIKDQQQVFDLAREHFDF